MRQNTSSTPSSVNPGLSDLELELQRRGQARDRTIAERERAASGLEVLGFDVVAHRLRHLNGCLSRADLSVAPPPAPRPGPAPRPTPPRPPILVALEGGGEPEPLSSEETFWADVDWLAARHDEEQLSLPARLTLDALRRLSPRGA